ncbi:hypothetical protein CHS0354_009114, partial [Potamilus streckersoni]
IYKMLSMLYIVFVIITEANAVNHLYNDTCSSISKSNTSFRVAIVKCHQDSIPFDPKSQNGALLLSTDNGSWTGEIFACQCSCRLPYNLPYGQIMSKGALLHGEKLDYKCDAGFEKNINEIIVCDDGVLLTISNYSEYNQSKISFRKMSLPETFADDFQGYVFHLELNATAIFSLPESDVRYNQKVYKILFNETQLPYYLYNGYSYQDGKVDLNKHQRLKCVKKTNFRTTTVPPEAFGSESLPTWIIVAMVIVGIIFIIFVVNCTMSRIKKKYWPTSEICNKGEANN